MRLYNLYLAAAALACLTCDVVLAFTGQGELSVYFVYNMGAFLVVTALFAYLDSPARRALSAVGAGLLLVLFVVVILEAVGKA